MVYTPNEAGFPEAGQTSVRHISPPKVFTLFEISTYIRPLNANAGTNRLCTSDRTGFGGTALLWDLIRTKSKVGGAHLCAPLAAFIKRLKQGEQQQIPLKA